MFFVDADIYHVAFDLLIVCYNDGSDFISSVKNSVK